MDDEFFDFNEHPENFYIMDEMINEDQKTVSSSEGCCGVFMILGIILILITIA
mgnify:CR=1 FL=1